MHDHEWFTSFRISSQYAVLEKRPIAYFCAEFALSDAMQIYAGGLGVLAGDMVREAADQKIPLVAIGIFYRGGYLHHDMTSEKVSLQAYPIENPYEVGLLPVTDEKNDPLKLTLPLHGRKVMIQAWKMVVGMVTIFLLDSNLEENDMEDRNITNRLYTADKEIRFKQEMILGICGMRLLEALRIHPSVYHMNEGHSSLLVMELAKHEMREHTISFLDALEKAKERLLFTNHTLLAAGNDIFNVDLVSSLLADYAEELSVPMDQLIGLGKISDSRTFSMTLLALRMAGRINAVSKLHAEKAQELWQDHQMLPITNGIHIPSWDAIKVNDFWQTHQQNKRALLHIIEEETGNVWQEDVLLIGWARRMVTYKRPLALFEDLQRFKELARNTNRPIRVVFAGQSHESDNEGAHLLQLLQQLIHTELQGVVVYLSHYRLSLAQFLTAGCDIWLNTPVVGFEACGTSGMKAALNGGLPLSTKDGWVYEAPIDDSGWIVSNEHTGEDVIQLLEKQILPLYYASDKKAWKNRMRNARSMILEHFSATTMLRKYIEEMYLPVITTHQ